MAHHCHRACVGRRRTALVALFAGLLLVVVPTAGASAPTVTRLIAQQATIEADFNTNGLKFNLNAGHVREFVDGVLTRDEVGAVGSLFTWECEVTPNGTSCGGGPSPWGADCRPFGTSPGLEFLPPGALEFSKKFGKAKLEALFECRRSDTGETLLLVIDLKWTAENSFFDSSVSDEPGPPRTVTEMGLYRGFPVDVKGSAFDGTMEWVNADTTGALVTFDTTTTVYE